MPHGFIDISGPWGAARLPALPGRPLSRLIWLEAVNHVPPGAVVPPPPALCGGLGRCGMCRGRFTAGLPEALPVEHEVFQPEELAAGWRLLCRHEARDGMVIDLPPLSGREARGEGKGIAGEMRLAVDFGTTSVVWQALASDGTVVACGALPNPQAGAGADVISRVQAALVPGGVELLRRMGVSALEAVIRELERDGGRVVELCLAANPAMTEILLGMDVSGLSRAPYHLVEQGGRVVSVAFSDFSLPAYIPPQLAPFVGGDASAGLACMVLGRQAPSAPFILADLGTNGELLLKLPDACLTASVALGPALEGIGLTCGGAAEPGAVAAVRLTPEGIVPDVMGGGKPTHICATGYFSLLHCLLRARVLTQDGLFARPDTPLGKRLARSLTMTPGGSRFYVAESLFCSGHDVEELLKVKAAFSLGIEALLSAAGLEAAAVTGLYLAGALGEHARPGDLAALGFVPAALAGRCHSVGNTALHGAALLASSPEARKTLESLARQCREVPLAGRADFTDCFVRHMRLGE